VLVSLTAYHTLPRHSNPLMSSFAFVSPRSAALAHHSAASSYDAHMGYLKSLWTVPMLLGGLFAFTLLARFIATVVHHGAQSAHDKLKTLKPGGGRNRTSSPSSDFDENDIASGSPAAAGIPGSVAAEEIEPVPVSRGSTIVSGDDEAQTSHASDSDDTSSWINRWSRGANAARNAFFLSLLVATIASLPIEYMCQDDDTMPGDAVPIPECRTCLSNAASMSIVILSWVYLALSAVWVMFDVGLGHKTSVAGTGLMMTLLAQPLVVAAFVLAFRRWNALRARDC